MVFFGLNAKRNGVIKELWHGHFILLIKVKYEWILLSQTGFLKK